MGKLDGRVAVVTGGERGIGRAISLAFAGEGVKVVISSRSADDLAAVVAQIEDSGSKGLGGGSRPPIGQRRAASRSLRTSPP